MCDKCDHNALLGEAVKEGFAGMTADGGGPFGALVVDRSTGEILGRGHNSVTIINDPTAHAEVMAIRNACKNEGNFHLKDAAIYTSCEPCPMCLSAIYWANIKEVYYSSDRNSAHNIGFSDRDIYDEISKPLDERKIKFTQIKREDADDLHQAWMDKSDRREY